jgi:dCMP deaminase
MNSKINYDDYFITLAYVVAQRSIDPSTKCGAVLVSADKRILSTGYNGPIKGSDDTKVPLERPAKYAHLLHSEENAIIAYSGSTQDLIGSTMYITGAPCHNCLRMILQKGIRDIVYPDGNLAVMQNQEELDICKLISQYTPYNVRVVRNLPNIVNILSATQDYIIVKNPTKFVHE